MRLIEKDSKKILGSLNEYLEKREYVWKPLGAKKFFTTRYYFERKAKHYLSGGGGNDYYIILYRGRDIDDHPVEKPWEKVHLHIMRNDREPICDYADLMDIKNLLLGYDAEGVMLFPSTEREVDDANAYHLWFAYNTEEKVWHDIPFGWSNGGFKNHTDPKIRGIYNKAKKISDGVTKERQESYSKTP